MSDSGTPAAVWAPANREPKVREVKHVLRAHEQRSTLMGLAIFFAAAGLYVVCLLAILELPWLYARVAAALVAGLSLALLFVVGHDACHGSLTSLPWLNRVIGRVCFIPCWHPYSAWEHSHNGLHHGYTNVRTLDPAVPPLDPNTYRQLSRIGRLLERAMRSPVGVGLLYILKVWLPYEILPQRGNRLPKRVYATFRLDCLSIVLYIVAQSVVMRLWFDGVSSAFVVSLGLLALLPPMVFFWLIGWAVHMHHTHPSVPWYNDRASWTFFRGHVRSVVHMEFPRPVELFLLNIMDHTAHHADPKVPLYRLHEAQKDIEQAFPTDIVHERFTIRGWLRIFRICRLYDYEQHRWLDWDGTPLTENLLQPAGDRTAFSRPSSAVVEPVA